MSDAVRASTVHCATIQVVHALLVLYLAGVAVALWRVDGTLPIRLSVGLAWPTAILAFGLTMALLLVAVILLFPPVGVSILTAAVLLWWLLI